MVGRAAGPEGLSDARDIGFAGLMASLGVLVRAQRRWYSRPPEAGSPTAGRPAREMRTTKQIITLVMGIVGILLIVRGVWGGVWPVSIQLIAGAVLLVYAILRWRFML